MKRHIVSTSNSNVYFVEAETAEDAEQKVKQLVDPDDDRNVRIWWEYDLDERLEEFEDEDIVEIRS